MTQVLALPWGMPVQEAPLLMVKKAHLERRLGKLTDSEQSAIDHILRSAFDVV
ncbi:MAG TPA: hypothetical protein VGR28_10840 [Candidatus Thermoplasmatota archaeon]|jgi:hypothetical protein|nr:hypothetical protein [Candidatus Thermoplasmatota archaeon]